MGWGNLVDSPLPTTFHLIFILITIMEKSILMSKSTLILVFLAVICVFVLGCSDGKLKTNLVSGIVKFNGEPVADATVTFVPVKVGEGDSAVGRTNEKGEYKLQTALGNADAGTTPGEYYVLIRKSEFYKTGKVSVDSSGRSSAEMLTREVLPDRYNGPNTPFKETVVKGKNVFNFNLED